MRQGCCPLCERCARAGVVEVTQADLAVLMDEKAVEIPAALAAIAAADDHNLVIEAVDTLQRSFEVEPHHVAQICRDVFDRLRDGGLPEDLQDQLIFAGVWASRKILEAVSY